MTKRVDKTSTLAGAMPRREEVLATLLNLVQAAVLLGDPELGSQLADAAARMVRDRRQREQGVPF